MLDQIVRHEGFIDVFMPNNLLPSIEIMSKKLITFIEFMVLQLSRADVNSYIHFASQRGIDNHLVFSFLQFKSIFNGLLVLSNTLLGKDTERIIDRDRVELLFSLINNCEFMGNVDTFSRELVDSLNEFDFLICLRLNKKIIISIMDCLRSTSNS